MQRTSLDKKRREEAYRNWFKTEHLLWTDFAPFVQRPKPAKLHLVQSQSQRAQIDCVCTKG